MSKRLYVGVFSLPFASESANGRTYSRQVFWSEIVPTAKSHGHQFDYCIGRPPFRTRAGADFMAKYGANNPHVQCVADAEQLAARQGSEASNVS